MAPLPAVVVTGLKVIGAKKVLPPSMMSADLPVPVPERLMRAQIRDAGAVDEIAGRRVHLRCRSRWRCSVGDASLHSCRKLLESIVTAGVDALISTPPGTNGDVAVRASVHARSFCVLVLVVSARVAETPMAWSAERPWRRKASGGASSKSKPRYCWSRTPAIPAQTLDLAPALSPLFAPA